MKLYAVRDRKTGKLVNNITNPKRRFWEEKYRCENACRCPNPYQFTGDKNDLEMVEFELVEDQEPKTNADRIRAMSDQELASALMCPNEMGIDEIPCNHSDTLDCFQCLLNWLRQTVREEK